jgi:quercetin dioxygenase-like cupin family protein
MTKKINRVIDAFSQLLISRCEASAFKKRELWDAFEVRDLGIAEATNGRVRAFHMRALRPFQEEQRYHWHTVEFHMVYILKGSVTYRWQGSKDDIVANAGDCLYQPSGAHNVVHYTDDVEVLEIMMPADYETRRVYDVA